MNNTNLSQKRILTFLFGCILTRSALVLLAYYLSKTKYLFWLGLVIFILGLSFFYLYYFGNERADTQTRVWGDDKIWWNGLRPIHGGLFILFGILAMCNINYAWIVLLIDVIFGLLAWMYHHNILF
jgi:hypothetical protein